MIGTLQLGQFGRGLAAASSVPISFVGAANSNSSSPAAIPAHSAGDLIICFARGSGASTPSLASGWTDIASASPAFVPGFRAYCILDTANTINTLSLPASTANAAFVVYRGASGAASLQMSAETSDTNIATIPALSGLAAGSWAIAAAHINQPRTPTHPGTLTRRADEAGTGGGRGLWYDSAAPVSSLAAAVVDYTGQGGALWVTYAFELLQA